MTPTRTLLFVAGLATHLAMNAQYAPPDPSGLQGVIVEKYYVADANDATDTDGGGGLTEGSVTYRVFVDLKPGYKLLTVGGYTDHPITMASSTTLFNNDDRGEAWGDAINDIHLDKNTVGIDSWLSMGAASDAHWGVLKSDDTDGSVIGGENNDGGSTGTGLLANDAPEMGVPLTTSDGLFASGTPPTVTFVGTPPGLFDAGGPNSYTNDNFAWAVLGGTLSPDTNNRILVGQFTTDGILTLCLNMWVLIPEELVCNDPNCHEVLEFYADILPSDTAGGGFNTQNKFTHPSLCFDSSAAPDDCEGVPNGPAQPGTSCDDGIADTDNDVYGTDCVCVGEDCEGVLGGDALPGAPCDDADPNTVDDTWQSGCVCLGSVGIRENDALAGNIRIAPNPTNGPIQLTIEDITGERSGYAVIDMFGKRILSKELGVLQGRWSGMVDLSALAQGAYFLEVRVDDRVSTRRVMKF